MARQNRSAYVVCRHCGRRFKAIEFRHLVYIHGYDPAHPVEEYKRRFRLRIAASASTRRKLSHASRTWHDENPAEPNRQRTAWTEAKAEKWVRSRSRRPRSLLARAVPRELRFFVRSRLGMTWAGFVASLGIVQTVARKRRDWSRETVIAEIRQRAESGQPLNHAAVFLERQALVRWAVKLFGSWNAAREAAGV